MLHDPLVRRLDTIIQSDAPAENLAALTRTLEIEGVQRSDIYSAFCSLRDYYSRAYADTAIHQTIISVMNRMTGWCDPDHRLFDVPIVAADEHIFAAFVAPFYMLVLNSNYSHMLAARENDHERQAFVRHASRAIKVIEESVISRLFDERNWRHRITAAWFCGVKKWRQFTPRIGSLMVPSQQRLAGPAYCFALARFTDEASASHLCRYLDEYLPQPQLDYDQDWALPALIWIDRVRGTKYSNPYTAAGDSWEQYENYHGNGVRRLEECCQRFDLLMTTTAATFNA